MIHNVSHNDKETRELINKQVGKPFLLAKRLKMGGNGSPRFRIVEASASIADRIARTNMINYCNIELREGGIIVGFRTHQEVYSWAIPFYKLSIHSTGKRYTLYYDTEYVRLENDHPSSVNTTFMTKLRKLQSQFLGDTFIDY